MPTEERPGLVAGRERGGLAAARRQLLIVTTRIMRSALPRHEVLAAWMAFLALAAGVFAVHAVVAPGPVDPQTPRPTPPGGAHHRLSPLPTPPLDVTDAATENAAAAAEFDDERIMFGERPLPRRPSASSRSPPWREYHTAR